MNSNFSSESQLADLLHVAESIRAQSKLTHAEPPSFTFERDCRDAVSQAIVLRRLRVQYRKTGFLALPLNEYLVRLTHLAQMPTPVGAITSTSERFSVRVKPWVQLAQKLDIATEQLHILIRTWFAVEVQCARPKSVMARGYRTKGSRDRRAYRIALEETASPERASTELKSLEALYTHSQRQELEKVLSDIL